MQFSRMLMPGFCRQNYHSRLFRSILPSMHYAGTPGGSTRKSKIRQKNPPLKPAVIVPTKIIMTMTAVKENPSLIQIIIMTMKKKLFQKNS